MSPSRATEAPEPRSPHREIAAFQRGGHIRLVFFSGEGPQVVQVADLPTGDAC